MPSLVQERHLTLYEADGSMDRRKEDREAYEQSMEEGWMRDTMAAKQTAYFLACLYNGLLVYIGSTGVMINGRLM